MTNRRASIVRYNRLIDTFLGLRLTASKITSETTVKVSANRIDELYIGLDKHGCHYVIPVQPKAQRSIGVVQTTPRYTVGRARFRNAVPGHSGAVAKDGVVALFELNVTRARSEL